MHYKVHLTVWSLYGSSSSLSGEHRELTGVARLLSLLFILVQAYEAVECLEEQKFDIITNHV